MIGAIDVRDLVGRPGASKVEHLSGTVDDLSTELASLSEDAPVTIELVLESLIEGVVAIGTLEGSLSLRCARCLKEFERGFSVGVSELFVPFPHEDSDEYPLDSEGYLDPDQMVRDLVGLELPFAPVCRPDCRGLCGRCGGDLNVDGCTCTDSEIDPRWEGLDALLDELNGSAVGAGSTTETEHRAENRAENREG
jgi:uncharacterized protein